MTDRLLRSVTNAPDDGAPGTLRLYLVGRNKHGSVTTVWDVPQQAASSSDDAGNAADPD